MTSKPCRSEFRHDRIADDGAPPTAAASRKINDGAPRAIGTDPSLDDQAVHGRPPLLYAPAANSRIS
jgi:hypothetical protein